jgi:hypothetical protein
MIPESSVDSTLRSDSVTSRGEQFGDTRSIEAGLCKTKGSAQTGTTSTNNNCIVFMVYHRILVRYMWLQTPVRKEPGDPNRGFFCSQGLHSVS